MSDEQRYIHLATWNEKPEKPGIWPRWADVLLAVLTLGLCWWLVYMFISAFVRGLEAL